MTETKVAYVVMCNTDLTEGRGTQYAMAVTENPITAKRLGEGRYVQGSDCPIEQVTVVKIDGSWYLPTQAVRFVEPSHGDLVAQELLTKKQVAIDKAKAAGLTDDDIKLIQGS